MLGALFIKIKVAVVGVAMAVAGFFGASTPPAQTQPVVVEQTQVAEAQELEQHEERSEVEESGSEVKSVVTQPVVPKVEEKAVITKSVTVQKKDKPDPKPSLENVVEKSLPKKTQKVDVPEPIPQPRPSPAPVQRQVAESGAHYDPARDNELCPRGVEQEGVYNNGVAISHPVCVGVRENMVSQVEQEPVVPRCDGIMCNGQCWSSCPSDQDFSCTATGAVCTLKRQIPPQPVVIQPNTPQNDENFNLLMGKLKEIQWKKCREEAMDDYKRITGLNSLLGAHEYALGACGGGSSTPSLPSYLTTPSNSDLLKGLSNISEDSGNSNLFKTPKWKPEKESVNPNNFDVTSDFSHPTLDLPKRKESQLTILPDGRSTSYTQIGNTTFGSDGSSYSKIGDTIFGNDGTSYSKIGDTTFGSDGSSATKIGDTIFTSPGF